MYFALNDAVQSIVDCTTVLKLHKVNIEFARKLGLDAEQLMNDNFLSSSVGSVNMLFGCIFRFSKIKSGGTLGLCPSIVIGEL